MNDCIFCKIVSGEFSSHKVYENEHVLSFLDIYPVNSGHVLVVPKRHYSHIQDTPDSELFEVMKTVKRIGLAFKSGLGIDDYNVVVNNGSLSGQIVPHLHFHIIPRIKGDGLEAWRQGKYKDGEAELICEKIKNQL